MDRRLRVRGRRGIAISVAIISAVGLAAYGGVAAAAKPQPTIDQVQAQVDSLQAQVDQVGNQYDVVTQQLGSANAKLASVQKREGGAEQQFLAARKVLMRVAIGSYENQNQSSALALLTSGSPGAVLQQSSLLEEIANVHSRQAAKFQSAASQVLAAQAEFQRTKTGVSQLQAQLTAKKEKLNKLLAQSQATLGNLNLQQQQQIAASTIGTGGITSATDPYGTSTPALKAVWFVYQQLGKPYLWGGTGPGSYDCSGLMQAAWNYAGVPIQRDTYAQWASLPHVPKASLQPGDIVFFENTGHDGMYVGGGYIIDAPSTGLVIRKLALDSDWYAQTYEGAVRP
jgi:cell wall-associated NlpC family hydrolase